jgi:hypothetical protein
MFMLGLRKHPNRDFAKGNFVVMAFDRGLEWGLAAKIGENGGLLFFERRPSLLHLKCL